MPGPNIQAVVFEEHKASYTRVNPQLVRVSCECGVYCEVVPLPDSVGIDEYQQHIARALIDAHPKARGA